MTADNNSRIILTDNAGLRARYNELKAGDVFIGRLRIKETEEPMLLDLVERGIVLFPSALSQLASRSKVFQTRLFATYMPPFTRTVHDIHDMLEITNFYHRNSIGRVVTKLDRKDAGLGIHLWGNVEEVYNQASLNVLPYPFVIQPFYSSTRDIRVLLLNDYCEAYYRKNPDNFRNNLHCGGHSSPGEVQESHLSICRAVMERGKFPYAHIDLMETGDNLYLMEINLRGGIKGAVISPEEYRRRQRDLEERELTAYLNQD